MVRAGGNVRRYAALGIAVAVTLLDADAAKRVGVVARPNLRKETQDTEVKPVAARGAALEEDMRKASCQYAHDLV